MFIQHGIGETLCKKEYGKAQIGNYVEDKIGKQNFIVKGSILLNNVSPSSITFFNLSLAFI